MNDRPYGILRHELLECRQARASEKTPPTTRGQERHAGRTATQDFQAFQKLNNCSHFFAGGGETMSSNTFMKVDEVAETLGISKSYAYKIVQKLNAELKEKGYLTISGRVNKQYFMEKTCYGTSDSKERK